MSKRCLGLLLALLVGAHAFAAERVETTPLPEALKDWRGWVLKDLEYRSCPFLATLAPAAAANYVCAWPGKLSVNADASGASFAQHWRVEAPSWVPLPGDARTWPQDVSGNAQSQPVLLHEGQPALWLEPGSYDLRGRLSWPQRPQSLRVPASIGIVELIVDGKPVLPPLRSGEALALGRGAGPVLQADALSLRVFRKLSDGVPGELDTRLQLDVAGAAREETLGPALPPGFAPLTLTGALPARLDADGKLHIQVQPGSWTLELNARALAPLAKVSANVPAAPWPQQEIWSYEAAPRLRVTNASSAEQIDPSQAGVPGEWREFPAFALANAGEIPIEERSRGLALDDANRLNLEREAWLDFSGAGFYAKDRIHGQMRRGWRLDATPPYTLQRASADGQDLLITRGAGASTGGVELRNPNVNLSAGLRIDAGGGSLPISGWLETFDAVALTLHLPYGYRLLAAPGADQAAGSWLSRWTLVDIFVIAVIALLGWRLLGVASALALLAYLVLGYQEPDSPLWLLAVLIVLALVVRALPSGRLQGSARALGNVAFVVFVLMALPFVAAQIRYAIYPQLESEAPFAMDQAGMEGYPVITEEALPMSVQAPPAPAQADNRARKSVAPETRQSIQESGAPAPPALNIAQRYADNTVIQAGRGEPDWHYGSTYQLSWSGPVLPAQSVHLVIAPAWLTRLLRLLMIALLAWIGARLVRSGGSWRNGGLRPGAAAMAFLLLGALPLAVHAEATPAPELLAELRARLTEAPKCAPQCATIAAAQVQAEGDSLRVALEVHAGERVAVPLPSADAVLSLRAVTLDGAAQDGLVRRDNALWLAVGRGVHRVELAFVIADADRIALPFPLRPAQLEFSGQGWQASGLDGQRLLTETLDLVRSRVTGAEPARASAQQFPAFVEVTRDLTLGLDWQITTSVARWAPAEGGFAVELPLLVGEHVQSAGFKVTDRHISVPLAAGAAQADWASQLDRAATLTLAAPDLSHHAEVWRVTLGPMWHAEFAGVPAVQPEDAGAHWVYEFHPLPGEKLQLTLTRPEAAAGSSLAIDAVELHGQIGKRASEHRLGLRLRSTQGGEHVIQLPPDAEVLGVSKNGAALNLRPRDGKLSLPLTPAAQSFEVRWRDNRENGARAATAAVNLNAPAANITLHLTLPEGRWLLFTYGPTVGPAVLYWGELLLLIVLAVALARSRRTPLYWWQWLLLGIGFSTFSWWALLVVAAWLLALDARQRVGAIASRRGFNLMQLGLAALTVIAMLSLVSAIPYGLLGTPDMHLTGNGSSATQLHWFADQSVDALPQAGVLSVPLWVYQLLMLLWALWLAYALIGWLRWGFGAWTRGGYWRGAPPKAPPPSMPKAPGQGGGLD